MILLILKSIKCQSDFIENLFVILFTIISSIFIILIPPGHVPDEGSHYIRVFSIGNSIKDFDNGEYEVLPKSIDMFLNKYSYNTLDNNFLLSTNSYYEDFMQELNYQQKSDNSQYYGNTQNATFLPYIFSVIVNKIFCLLGVSPLIIFLSCRYINMLFSAIILYLAITMLKTLSNKILFMTISLFPIFLQHSLGILFDYITNSICLLFICYILNLKSKKNMQYYYCYL